MYTITIKGEARAHARSCGDQDYEEDDDIDDTDGEVDIEDLSILDGIDCQECFSEYFDGDESYAQNVEGGYMHFEYKDGQLWTVTVYESSRELTNDELSDLEDYTTGQWSDGIGEGFEQEPCMEDDGIEYFISPWHRNQEVTVTQTLD